MTPWTPMAREVGRYYDRVGPFFEAVWGDNLHCGYWPEGEEQLPLREAQERLTTLVAERSGLRSGDWLLDVGCGTGGPAVQTARGTGCRVAGVTVSRSQARTARWRARDEGMSGTARFLLADAMDLPFRGGSFAVAWAVESLFHMASRARALAEVARVLAPGGRVLLTDLVERHPLSEEERTLFRTAFAIHDVAPRGAYDRLLPEAGLREDGRVDLTRGMQRTWRGTIDALGARQDELADLYGPAFVPAMRELIPQVVSIYDDNLSYVLFVARKANLV